MAKKFKSRKAKKSKTKHVKKEKLANNFYYVDQVLGSRTLKNGKTQLYVSWVGFSPKHNSWVYSDTVMLEEEFQRANDPTLSTNQFILSINDPILSTNENSIKDKETELNEIKSLFGSYASQQIEEKKGKQEQQEQHVITKKEQSEEQQPQQLLSLIDIDRIQELNKSQEADFCEFKSFSMIQNEEPSLLQFKKSAFSFKDILDQL